MGVAAVMFDSREMPRSLRGHSDLAAHPTVAALWSSQSFWRPRLFSLELYKFCTHVLMHQSESLWVRVHTRLERTRELACPAGSVRGSNCHPQIRTPFPHHVS